jgi:hypothetical protein
MVDVSFAICQLGTVFEEIFGSFLRTRLVRYQVLGIDFEVFAVDFDNGVLLGTELDLVFEQELLFIDFYLKIVAIRF